MKDNIKEFKLGVVCGRLNHEHLGHKFIIDIALEKCKKVLILIGSAQEQSTLRNPFSLETRINIIKKTFSDISSNRLIIKGLNDMTNEYDVSYDWGKYVKNHIFKYTGQNADFIITGDDDNRSKWFSPDDTKDITQEIISRDKIKVSATTVRGALLIGNQILWKSFVPEPIYDMYDELRLKLLSIPIYMEIFKKLQSTGKLTMENYLKIYSEYEIIDKHKKMEEIK